MAEYDTDSTDVEEPTEAPAEEPTEAPEDSTDEAPTEDTDTDDGDRGDDGDHGLARVRKEAAAYRVRAREAEERVAALQQQIFDLLVKADGRLADPGDLPYADDLADADSVGEAISALLEAKPHYAARKPAALPEQSIGQEPTSGPTFGELLRSI